MPKNETTSENVASASSFVLQKGDNIISEVIARIPPAANNQLIEQLREYHRCAKSAAASALTQREAT